MSGYDLQVGGDAADDGQACEAELSYVVTVKLRKSKSSVQGLNPPRAPTKHIHLHETRSLTLDRGFQ
jgi:hypothetical protein